MSLTVVGMRCGLTRGRMAVTDRSRRGRGACGPSRTAGGNAEWCVRHRQRHGVASENGKRDAELLGDFISGYTSKESENTNSKSRVTPLVTAALLARAKTWKPARQPPTEDRLQARWCMVAVEYYSVRKSEIFPSAATWADREGTALGGVSPMEKDKCHVILFICGV